MRHRELHRITTLQRAAPGDFHELFANGAPPMHGPGSGDAELSHLIAPPAQYVFTKSVQKRDEEDR